MVQGFIEIAYGQLPSVDVDTHHDGSPSKQSRPTYKVGLTLRVCGR